MHPLNHSLPSKTSSKTRGIRMDGQKWPFLAVNRPSQAHRASTSGKNTESLVFPLEKLTIPGENDLTFGFKNDAMHCKICFQMNSRRHLSFCIAIGPALEMLCFLHSNAQGWPFADHHSLKSSKFCDVCGQSLFIHFSSPSRDRCLLNFHKPGFFLKKNGLFAHDPLVFTPT